MRRLATSLLLAALTLTAMPVQAQFGELSGLLGRAQRFKNTAEALRGIGEQEEIRLGGDLSAIILGAAPLVQDPDKQRYVNRLGRWLALHGERPNLPWKFGIVESDDFNAFSMPGGYVLITRGLFDRMRNESELAAVLSHEIAHVVKKHHIKKLQQGLGPIALGEFNGYISGAAGPAGPFAQALIASGKDMFTHGLDKDDEFEADRMGVVIATRSGFSPYGMAGVLQTLTASQDEKRFSLVYKTHPLPVDRIARLDQSMGTRLDGIQTVVEDLPSFTALRTPPKPVVQPAPAAATRPRTRRRN